MKIENIDKANDLIKNLNDLKSQIRDIETADTIKLHKGSSTLFAVFINCDDIGQRALNEEYVRRTLVLYKSRVQELTAEIEKL